MELLSPLPVKFLIAVTFLAISTIEGISATALFMLSMFNASAPILVEKSLSFVPKVGNIPIKDLKLPPVKTLPNFLILLTLLATLAKEAAVLRAELILSVLNFASPIVSENVFKPVPKSFSCEAKSVKVPVPSLLSTHLLMDPNMPKSPAIKSLAVRSINIFTKSFTDSITPSPTPDKPSKNGPAFFINLDKFLPIAGKESDICSSPPPTSPPMSLPKASPNLPSISPPFSIQPNVVSLVKKRPNISTAPINSVMIIVKYATPSIAAFPKCFIAAIPKQIAVILPTTSTRVSKSTSLEILLNTLDSKLIIADTKLANGSVNSGTLVDRILKICTIMSKIRLIITGALSLTL